MVTTIKLMNPEDFRVARVISLIDNYTKSRGYITYLRPLTQSYNKSVIDDFDNSMIDWIKELKYQEVQFVHASDVVFDYQKPQIEKIYNGGRPSSKLLLTCHGDYSFEELVKLGQINAKKLDLPIYWNALGNTNILDNGGVFTFDKSRERDFFEIMEKIEFI